MATHLVKILSLLGWIEIPGPARTPLSRWQTHSPGAGRAAGGREAGGSRTTPTPHWGFPVPPTHTPKIAIPQLRGDYQLARINQ